VPDKLTQNEAASAAMSPTRPLVVADRLFACRAPLLSDLAAIQVQIRKSRDRKSTPLGALVNDPAFKLLPAAAQVEAAKIAAQAQVSGQHTTDLQTMAFDLLEGLQEPEVLAFAVWLCCRGPHGDLKLTEVRALISEDNAPEVFADFTEASGMLALAEKNAAGPSPSPSSGTGGPSLVNSANATSAP